MSDIVERLRNYIPGEHEAYVPEMNALAIAEIERLRAALFYIEQMTFDGATHEHVRKVLADQSETSR